jgi:hypothetical protein
VKICWSVIRSVLIAGGVSPLLIIGSRRVADPGVVNAVAYASSRYPSSTALRRDTLASLSVPCTTRSLLDGALESARSVPRPRPRPRRNVFRLGMWEAAMRGGGSLELGLAWWGLVYVHCQPMRTSPLLLLVFLFHCDLHSNVKSLSIQCFTCASESASYDMHGMWHVL